MDKYQVRSCFEVTFPVGYDNTIGNPKGRFFIDTTGASANQVLTYISGTTVAWAAAGGGATTLIVNSTPITSGTVGRVLFQGTGNVLQQSANLFWDNTNTRLNIGGVGTVLGRLSILSPTTTGLAIQVRNNADTGNQFSVDGNGLVSIQNTATGNGVHFVPSAFAGSGYSIGSSATLSGTNKFLVINPSAVQAFDTLSGGRTSFTFSTSSTGTWELLNSLDRGTFRHSAWSSYQFEMQNGNFSLQDSNARRPSSGARCVLMLTNGVASSNVQDTFQLYAADITAGNSAPHFQTENGNVIKIYRETTAVAAAVRVHNNSQAIHTDDTFDGYTIAQVVKALRNFGQLA
jgi:hypothetical protein